MILVKKIRLLLLFLITITAISACKWGVNLKGKDLLFYGEWRGELSTKGGSLPFLFTIERKSDSNFVFTLQNSDELIETKSVFFDGDSLIVQFPVYESVLIAGIKGIKGDTLVGSLVRTSFDEETSLPFFAIAGGKYTFSAKQASQNINIEGKWETTFYKPDQSTTKAAGIFQQDGMQVKGTFLTPYGDYRYLSGLVDGDSVYLAGFDAATAYLLKAKLKNDTLLGMFYSGNAEGRPILAFRNDNYEIENVSNKTYILPNSGKLNFAFPNYIGETVSLQDPMFQNKVVIVQILGTWCHNCLDETKFLKEIYDEFHKDGLEIIGLSFERTRIQEKAFDNIKKLKERFNVPYPLLFAGSPEPNALKEALPQISEILGYPTTIVLDRNGEIAHLEVGFNGPSTGELYTEYTKTFRNKIKELLK